MKHSPIQTAGKEQSEVREIDDLRLRLREADETLDAIRNGEVDAIVVNSPDGTQIYTLENADKPYRLLVEQMQEGALTLNAAGRILYCNQRFATLICKTTDEIVGAALTDFAAPSHRAPLAALIAGAAESETRGELMLLGCNDEIVAAQISLARMPSEKDTVICGIVSDLTEYNRRSTELADTNARLREQISTRERAEAQLRQSQKMEAIGQLTGGIAHDFNNLLQGIIGSLTMMRRRMDAGRADDIEKFMDATTSAALRAASLTQRLLAFSRRQTLAPKGTDMNELLSGMLEFIGRSVGPEIMVKTLPAADVWPTLVDPSQLENALLNLCINAHDAMPKGGELTIETANRVLDAQQAAAYDLAPGAYVSLAVSDSGSGMTPDVVARAFDPFFTTKPIGLGTGLGLSMVYGFAKQSGGQAVIESEVDKGTTVRILLPRHFGAAEAGDKDSGIWAADAPQAVHRETVLVVDDEPVVRMLVLEVLEELGCDAVEASDGPAGLKILNSKKHIDLLITDVGLPNGMNGRQLADAARVVKPDLKVLFITGYAESAVMDKITLDPRMKVLTKPFAMEALAHRVKEMVEFEGANLI